MSAMACYFLNEETAKKLKDIQEKHTFTVVCHLVFCWHAKGILSTFVSVINNWLSNHRLTLGFCTKV